MVRQKIRPVYRSGPDDQTNRSDDALLLICAKFQTIDGKLDDSWSAKRMRGSRSLCLSTHNGIKRYGR
jgi:hypothetical protein